MYIIGDTHGIRPIFEIVDNNNLVGKNLIHVGDFGLGFEPIERDLKNLGILDEMLIDTNNTLYVIRGNHDNPIFWDKSKGLNLPKFHNLKLVDDYTVHEIENKKVLFVGGALSIDRRPRMADFPYPTWWKDEEFKYNEIKLHDCLKKHKNIDVVITHTAPDFCYPTDDNVYIVNHYHIIESAHGVDLKLQLKQERQEMTEMYHDLTIHHGKKPKHWFYGHFHDKKEETHDNIQFHLLDINELFELV